MNTLSGTLLKYVISALIFLAFNLVSFAQESDSIKAPVRFGGTVTITNNGISLIPNLTLGKPAAMFDMTLGRRVTFEPQFRFSLEGKPWTFILWWRYRLHEGKKLRINIGAYPAFAFRNKSFVEDNLSKENIIVQRYLAGEIYPNLLLSKNISTGIYLLHAYGVEKDAIKNTSLLAFRLNFSDVRLTEKYFIRFFPQVYYLRMDENEGFYYTSSVTVARRNFPVSVSSMLSTPFRTSIAQDKKIIWNISLAYVFGKEYVVKQ